MWTLIVVLALLVVANGALIVAGHTWASRVNARLARVETAVDKMRHETMKLRIEISLSGGEAQAEPRHH